MRDRDKENTHLNMKRFSPVMIHYLTQQKGLLMSLRYNGHLICRGRFAPKTLNVNTFIMCQVCFDFKFDERLIYHFNN